MKTVYTMKQFEKLERDAEGNLINLSKHFLRLNHGQVLLLSEADQVRFSQLEEEYA